MTISPRFFAVCALALLAAAFPLRAQEPQWTPLGPFGGKVESLAVHPTDSRIVYAGGRAGIARSVDGGTTWTTLATNPSGELLALDPSRPSTLYATGKGHGGLTLLFKSVDRGAHWAAVTGSPQFEGGYLALAVDPARPSRLFLGLVENGLWRSLDGGASWRLAVQGLPDGVRTSISAVAAAPKPFSGTVFVGAGGRGLFRSANSGDSWKRVRGLPAARVSTIAIAPSDPRTVYVSFGNQGLFRSTDAGSSWRAVQELPLRGEVVGLAVHPGRPATVYALDAEGRIFRTQDGGAQWARLSPMSRALTLAVAPSDGRIVFAGGEPDDGEDLGGVAVSSDAGASWQRRNQGLTGLAAGTVAIDPADPETVWAGTEGPRLFLGPGGPPWLLAATWHGAGLTSVEQILFLEDAVLARIDASLWRLDDGAGSWRQIPGPTSGLWRVWLDPGDPEILYAATHSGIFRGDAEGTSWIRLADPALPCGFTSFLVAPVPAGPLPALYAGGVDNVHPGNSNCQPLAEARVLRSLDGGASWLSSQGLPKGVVTALAADPSNPAVLYAGITAFLVSHDPGVWKSLDQGKTWTRTGLAGFAVATSITAIAVSPAPGRVYAATPDGRVFRSADGGATWSDWSAGLKVRTIEEILVDPDDPGRVYLASSNGIWVLEEE